MADEEPAAFPFQLLMGEFGTPSRLYTRPADGSHPQITLPSGDPAYLVLDHEEVEQVLRDRRFSRNFRYPGAPRMVAGDDMSLNPDAIVNLDPPEHTRLRRTIQSSFRPGHAAHWRPAVEAVVGRLLDQVEAAGPLADLAAAFALPLPLAVMCDLLAIPEADHAALMEWTGIFFATSEVTARQRLEAGTAFLAYVRELVLARRAQPAGGLVEDLIRACDDGALSVAELHQMIASLLIGGQENTSATLSRGLFTLLRHPEQYRALAADPGLVNGAVEEILRFDVPSEGAFLRVTTQDVELSSGTVPRGSAVQVSIPAANRDERRFADPERFDVRRTQNPHLTFGAGAHFCVGAPLARLELQVALGAVVARLPGLRLARAADEIEFAQDTLVRPVLSLPVTW